MSEPLTAEEARKRLMWSWFEAHPNQPMPEGKREFERLLDAARSSGEVDGQILETLEPDPVYVTAREVVAAYKRRPYCGTDTSRAIKELDAALDAARPSGEVELDVERLREALRVVTRPLHIAGGDKGLEKWLTETTGRLAAEYAGHAESRERPLCAIHGLPRPCNGPGHRSESREGEEGACRYCRHAEHGGEDFPCYQTTCTCRGRNRA